MYENVRFECLVTVQVANVTFRDCEFVGPLSLGAQPDKGLITCINANVANLQIERCRFKPQTPVRGLHGIIGHDYTLSRCEITRVEDGIKGFHASGGSNNKCNINVSGCWVHHLHYVCPDPNQSDNRTHNDCIQMGSGVNENLSVIGCRLEAFIDTATSTYSEPTFVDGIQQSGYQYFSNNGAGGPGGTWSTSSGIFAPLGTSLDNIVFDQCWIDGGFSASLNFGSWTTATNLFVTRNRWGRDQRLGEDWHIIAKSAQAITITDNVYEDDGTPDNSRHNG